MPVAFVAGSWSAASSNWNGTWASLIVPSAARSTTRSESGSNSSVTPRADQMSVKSTSTSVEAFVRVVAPGSTTTGNR